MAYCLLLSPSGQAVGDGVQQSGLSEATPVVVNNDGSLAMPLVAYVDLFAAQIDWSFIAFALKTERVVLFDRASRLGVEQFVGVLRGGQELFGTTTSDELSCSEKTSVNEASDEEAIESRCEGSDWRERMFFECFLQVNQCKLGRAIGFD